MMYQFTEKCIPKSTDELWQFLANGLSNDVTIRSIRDKDYTINYITKDEVNFTAATRNEGEPDSIRYIDFITVAQRLKELKQFNTSSSKELFKGTKIYKKRSPFFALLLASGLIENRYM